VEILNKGEFMHYPRMFTLLVLNVFMHVTAYAMPIHASAQKGYGITHFIIGQPALPSPISSTIQDTVDSILFAPDDDVLSHLLHLIDKETTSIKATIFLLTDERIMQSLINAHERGVNVEIIVDPRHMYDRFSRISHLCKHNMCIFIFNPKYNDPAGTGLMHNKFIIFGTEADAASAVWTGSFNLTKIIRNTS
jgi:phosphatidylserine/phosphatidylglycerophosphate/cardiolipin synthase-like enzyme